MFALAAAQLVTVAVTLVVGYFAAQNPDDLPGVLDKIPLFSLGQSMVEHFQKLAEPGADYIRRLQESLSVPPPVMEKPFDFTRQCPVDSHLMLSDLFTCDRDSISHTAPASGPGFLESLLAPLGLFGHQQLEDVAILLMVLYLVTTTIVIVWRLTVCGINILAKRCSKSDNLKRKSRAILLQPVERDILDASQATAATDRAPVVHPVPVTAIPQGPIHVDPRDAPPEEPFTGVPGMAAQIIERFNAAGASVNTSSSKANAKRNRKAAASRAPYGKGKEYLNVTATLKENAAPKIDKGKGRAVEPVEQDEWDGKSQKASSSKAKTGIPHIVGRPYRPSALRNVTNAPSQDTD